MYTEIIQPSNMLSGIQRIKEVVDPASEYLSDEDIKRIIIISSGMIDRAVVKCFLGVIQKAKEKKQSDDVVRLRNELNRFEAGLINV